MDLGERFHMFLVPAIGVDPSENEQSKALQFDPPFARLTDARVGGCVRTSILFVLIQLEVFSYA